MDSVHPRMWAVVKFVKSFGVPETIVARGTPRQMAPIERLVADLDKP